jgi:hypothetical protein
VAVKAGRIVNELLISCGLREAPNGIAAIIFAGRGVINNGGLDNSKMRVLHFVASNSPQECFRFCETLNQLRARNKNMSSTIRIPAVLIAIKHRR